MKPDSALTRAAERYIRVRSLKTRSISNSCRMFDRLVGALPVRSINAGKLELFTERARALQYAETSIEKHLCDVKTIIGFVTGRRLEYRPPVNSQSPGRRKPPKPPEPIEETDDVGSLSIVSWAKRYCRTREVTRREPIYTANRFVKLVGSKRVSEITTETLVEFRDFCVAEGLSARTIESRVSDLQTLVRAAIGTELKPGRRCRASRPIPKAVPLSTLAAMWPHCDKWVQQWMALTFWTGMRLADVLRMQLSFSDAIPERLEWTASKTKHFFQWPIVPWVEQYLTRRAMPFSKSNDWGFRQTRIAIEKACKAAGVPVWRPKHFRQFAITAWMQADPVAGQIIHGCGLNGVLKHYVAPMTILESAAKKLDVPAFFKGDTKESQQAVTVADLDPVKLFSQLDENTKRVMMQTMLAMLGAARQ